jgi:guanosine-3',5'-bis(diphosphate) 3'-pyrophosphohydrolase
MDASTAIPAVLKALHFAADKHRDQRRKGAEASPYVNHLIEVAELLAREGRVTDVLTLQAALLHETLEDTETTPAELDARFGVEVRRLVEEVTDDKQLSTTERKRLQITQARQLSARAKLVKLADKIANLRSLVHVPPVDWSLKQKREYVAWSERVGEGLRGGNVQLERSFAAAVAQGRRSLGVSLP